MGYLSEKIRELQAEGVFLGGPPDLFEAAGRKLLMVLLSEGLTPNSRVLDIGCGCLRGGYWLIHFLNPGCYFGIEPNKTMVDAGVRILLEPEEAANKKPQFDYGEKFDFSIFGELFDYFVARSIWSHASKGQIKCMLDGFVQNAKPTGMFLTSYKEAKTLNEEYEGAEWVGRNHRSNAPGVVRHSFSWIKAECEKRGLSSKEINTGEYNFGDQVWIKIRRPAR